MSAGSGWPSQLSERNPPQTVPYASKCTPWRAQVSASAPGETAVQQRADDLVGPDRNAVGQRQVQMRRVEIGHADLADQPLLAQRREFLQRVKPGGVLEAPPVELQKVDSRDPEPVQPLLDPGTNGFRRHPAGRRAPLGEGQRVGTSLQETRGDDLGAAVVIRHVERVKAAVGIVSEVIGDLVRVQTGTVALHVRDLPKAGQDAADDQFVGQAEPVRRCDGHGRSPAPT